jgi:hypothetical protein
MLHAETQHEIKSFFAKVLKELNALNCEYFFRPELNFGKMSGDFPNMDFTNSGPCRNGRMGSLREDYSFHFDAAHP